MDNTFHNSELMAGLKGNNESDGMMNVCNILKMDDCWMIFIIFAFLVSLETLLFVLVLVLVPVLVLEPVCDIPDNSSSSKTRNRRQM